MDDYHILRNFAFLSADIPVVDYEYSFAGHIYRLHPMFEKISVSLYSNDTFVVTADHHGNDGVILC